MILARHAEALFWAGRQLERAEQSTRSLDVIARDSMHFRATPDLAEWRLLLEALGVDQAFVGTGGGPAEVARFLMVGQANPGSVAATIEQLRENIRTVRDRVPVELWEETNRLHLALAELRGQLPDEPFELYSAIRRRCHAIGGVVGEAMPRDEGFAFFVVGRMLERALLTCRAIRCLVLRSGHALDEGTILRTLSSLQAYRRRANGQDRLALASFLLQADDVPRTVLSCLRRADGRLQRIAPAAPSMGPVLTLVGRARSRLEYGDTEAELRSDGDRVLLQLEAELTAIARAIADFAFDPAQAPAIQAQFVRPGQLGDGWDRGVVQ